MKSELEKNPLMLKSIQQYWGERHMDDLAFAHYLIGMHIAAYALGKQELASEIDMLEAVFAVKAWKADELQPEAA